VPDTNKRSSLSNKSLSQARQAIGGSTMVGHFHRQPEVKGLILASAAGTWGVSYKTKFQCNLH
jgi:hypothetical protein